MRVLSFGILVVLSFAYVENKNPFSEEFINEINRKQSLWKAGKNFDDKTTINDLRKLMGVIKKPVKGFQKHFKIKEDIPESFDAREQWSNCSSISEVTDQSACGSCWAVASASCMSDRLCIHTGGESQIRISAGNILSCCSICGYGCYGGIPLLAWVWWQSIGVVTGGLYNTSLGCQPYPFANCEHYDTSGSYPECPLEIYPTPDCSHTCTTSDNYEDSVTYGASAYYIDGEQDMQQEILDNGPLVADFYVYSDFVTYKSGIYKYTAGDLVGAHAVKIIGWGVENGIKYWLAVNSWNEEWGDNGLFKIIRGTNECEIEENSAAGMPNI